MVIKESKHVASELTFAIREGKLVSIGDLSLSERGLASNCYCPQCHVALEACMGPLRPRYFRHEKNAEDCGATNETALHIFAKHCLVDAAGTDKIFLIPRVEKGKSFEMIAGVNQDAVGILDAQVEYRCATTQSIADVRLHTTNGWHLNVEIKVTHGIDENKAANIASVNAFTMEIDLTSINSSKFVPSEVEAIVLGFNHKTVWNHPDAIRWQHNPNIINKPQLVAKKIATKQPQKRPPTPQIIISQNTSYQLNECYLGHTVSASENGLAVSLQFCDEHGEIQELPVIKAYARHYASIFEKLEPGFKIMVITHSGEVVNVRGY